MLLEVYRQQACANLDYQIVLFKSILAKYSYVFCKRCNFKSCSNYNNCVNFRLSVVKETFANSVVVRHIKPFIQDNLQPKDTNLVGYLSLFQSRRVSASIILSINIIEIKEQLCSTKDIQVNIQLSVIANSATCN